MSYPEKEKTAESQRLDLYRTMLLSRKRERMILFYCGHLFLLEGKSYKWHPNLMKCLIRINSFY